MTLPRADRDRLMVLACIVVVSSENRAVLCGWLYVPPSGARQRRLWSAVSLSLRGPPGETVRDETW